MIKMNFGLMLSLEEISLRRMAVILWNHPDILISINNLGVKDTVVSDMRKIELPPMLAEQMKHKIQHIGSEIKTWTRFHQKYLNCSNEIFHSCILEKLHWTVLGTIDYRQTAEKLMRCERLDIVKRYRLACLYCLEDHIPVLWEQFPEESKIYFYYEESHFYKKDRPLRDTRPLLEFCWPYILKGGEAKLVNLLERTLGNTTTFNQYAFEYSASKGNKSATEYFFQKLTINEKEFLLFKTAQAVPENQKRDTFSLSLLLNFPHQKCSDTFCYLLSLMSPTEQMEIFKASPIKCLTYFLDWPWQYHFMNIIGIIWNFFTETDFIYLLGRISSRIRTQNCVCYTKLFQKFFLHGLSKFKDDFVDEECRTASSFNALFAVQDSETIKIILRNVDSVDRKSLCSSSHVLELFLEFSERGEYRFVEMCLHEANFSEEEKQAPPSDINLRYNLWTSFLNILYKRKAEISCKRSSEIISAMIDKCIEVQDTLTKRFH